MATFVGALAASLFAVDLVGLVFHVSVITLLIHHIRRKDPSFRQGFYVLFITVSLADWLYVVNSWPYIRLPFSGLFLDYYRDNWLMATALAVVSNYCCFLQPFGHAAIAMNRFTAFFLPAMHTSLWSGRRLKFAISLLLVIPLPFIALPATKRENYRFINSGQASPALMDPQMDRVMPILAGATFGTCSLLSFVLSTAAAMKYRSLVRKGLIQAGHSQDLRLLVHTIFMLVVQLMRVLLNALIAFGVLGRFGGRGQFAFWLLVDAYCLLDAISLVLIRHGC